MPRTPPRHSHRFARRIGLILSALLFLPVLASGAASGRLGRVPWYEARRDSSGLAPDPATTTEAIIQAYAARTVSWRGVFAVHTWIVVKPAGAARYTRYEVVGFGVQRGVPAIAVDRTGPDNWWFGAEPTLILDRRGEGVDALIAQVKAAVASYPYPQEYRPWPGPNSNTFIAHIGRQVPALRLTMPANAIGKDYIPGNIVGRAPSGTGIQLSLFGLAGVMAGWDEGLEVNILGLTLGVDIRRPALKLPAIGRLGLPIDPS